MCDREQTPRPVRADQERGQRGPTLFNNLYFESPWSYHSPVRSPQCREEADNSNCDNNSELLVAPLLSLIQLRPVVRSSSLNLSPEPCDGALDDFSPETGFAIVAWDPQGVLNMVKFETKYECSPFQKYFRGIRSHPEAQARPKLSLAHSLPHMLSLDWHLSVILNFFFNDFYFVSFSDKSWAQGWGFQTIRHPPPTKLPGPLHCKLALPLVPRGGDLFVIVHVLQIIVKLRVDIDMNSLIMLRSHWRHSFVIVALLIFNIWRESWGCHLFTALKKCFLNQALELEADYELLHGAGQEEG